MLLHFLQFQPSPPALRDTVSAFYDRAVVRALADQFVPYENASGIINPRRGAPPVTGGLLFMPLRMNPT